MHEDDVNAAKNGDEVAFGRLLELYSPLILSLVEQIGGNSVDETEKEDLRQEASLALFRASLTYKTGDVTFGLYAKICIKNRLISYLRRTADKKDVVTCALDVCEQTEADPSQRPDNAIIDAESLQALKDKIGSCLTELEYDVFIRYADGESRAEIAKALSVPSASVSNAIYRVKTKLKKTLYKTNE